MPEAKPPESVQRIQKTGSTLWLVLVSSCRWVDVQLLPSLTLVTFYFFAFMRESPSTDKCQGCQEGQPTHKHICTINLTSEWSRWRNLLCIHGDARWNIFPGFDPILSCPVLRTSGQQCNGRLETRSRFSSSPYGQGHRLEINPRIHVLHRGEKLEQLGWKRKREIQADRLNDLNPGTSSFQC